MRWSVLLSVMSLLAGCVTAGSAGRSSVHREPELVTESRHRVEEGQTLYSIARIHGVTPEVLARHNRILNPKALRAGDTLAIPSEASVRRLLARERVEVASARSEVRSATASSAVAKVTGSSASRTALAAAAAGRNPASSGRAETKEASRKTSSVRADADSARAAVAERRPSTSSGRVASANARTSSPRRARGHSGPEVGGAKSGGVLSWPLRGVLYARFGKKGREPHDGIDLAAPLGTPIRTAKGGRVLYAGEQRAYGKIAIVDHGNELVTLYAHCNDLRVKTGQQVRDGQVIATVGESGRTSGPHLHLEVRRSGRPVDPLIYLQSSRPKASARRGAR